ncbi:TetR family transcriptional regulator [Novosphingobium terrae]|uniref:TetR family transcriptional regulator n=1 Tax=Novosphingobium terrae TaxID=2726189 RepID=UPI00197CFF31|nr:TetR family transcriptional regulator [Novosphingobium terrae]
MTAHTIPPSSTSSSPSDREAAARERILTAALQEFAEHGWGGARVDRIAERADINKRMLYAYVGNKQALWVAVLERVYERMRQGEHLLHLEAASPVDGMRMLIRFNFRFHQDHPEFLSMLNEENRQKAENLKNSRNVTEIYNPLIVAIKDLLDRGRQCGDFRGNVSPIQLYISIASLSYFYFSNRHTLSTIFNTDLGSVMATIEREDHVVEVVMGYLRP